MEDDLLNTLAIPIPISRRATVLYLVEWSSRMRDRLTNS